MRNIGSISHYEGLEPLGECRAAFQQATQCRCVSVCSEHLQWERYPHWPEICYTTLTTELRMLYTTHYTYELYQTKPNISYFRIDHN